jgi:hypothetical protein
MNFYRQLSALTCLIVIALCAMSVQAQSGRRHTKPPPAAPVPTPTPEPAPIKKAEKEPELIFLVARDRLSGPLGIPFVFYDAAKLGCAERLRKASSVDVDIAQGDMSRGDAIEKAKSEQKTYVVLLALKVDIAGRSYDDLQLDFIVFEPVTARVVLTGRSYLNSNRAGPVVVGPTSRLPSGVYREQWLREAGEDAAERILKKLKLGQVPLPR